MTKMLILGEGLDIWKTCSCIGLRFNDKSFAFGIPCDRIFMAFQASTTTPSLPSVSLVTRTGASKL